MNRVFAIPERLRPSSGPLVSQSARRIRAAIAESDLVPVRIDRSIARSVLASLSQMIATALDGKRSMAELAHDERQVLRSDIYLAAERIVKLDKQRLLAGNANRESLLTMATLRNIALA